MERNWIVTWQGPARTETRRFNDRMAAQMYADQMNARSYRYRATVSYTGMTDHARATFAAGAL